MNKLESYSVVIFITAKKPNKTKGKESEMKKTLSQQATERDADKMEMGQRSGDHVFQYQDRAVEEGFRNVSKPWYNQTQDFDQVKEAVASSSEECSDLVIDPEHLRLSEDSTLNLDGETLTLTSRARRMLTAWAKIPAGVSDMLQEDGEGRRLFADLFNYGMEKNHGERENSFKVRLRGTEVRAVFSERYSPVDNGWFLEVLSAIAQGGRVSHLRFDGDTISGLALIPDTIRAEQDSDYGGGIHFRNSEVGESSLYVCPSVFRSICMNGCIWGELEGQSLIRRIHTGDIKLPVLAARIDSLVQEQIPLTVAAIDQMLRTKDIRLSEGTISAVRVIANLGKVNKEARREWLKGYLTEGDRATAFGVIQGLTRGAQALGTEQALQMEELAGSLTQKAEGYWNRQEVAFADMEDAELVRVFGEDLLVETGAF